MLLVAAAGVIFSMFVALVIHLAGVSPVLNVAVVLCLFIVLGCAIAYSSQEKKELEVIKEQQLADTIDEILPNINQIVSLLNEVDSRVKQCNELIESSGKRLSDSAYGQLKAVLQIRDKLDERANTVRSLIDSKEDEKIKKAKQMLDQPLTFRIDAVNSVLLTGPRMPDLPREQWEETVNSILDRVSKEAQNLI